MCIRDRVYAANSFTFFNYHAETCTLQWKPQLHYVFSDEKIKERFQRALDEVNGEHHKMAFRYSYPQIGSIMIKDCSIYAFLEANIINQMCIRDRVTAVCYLGFYNSHMERLEILFCLLPFLL